jgi:ribosome modulation factor
LLTIYYNATVENFSIVEKISYLCAFQRGRRAGLKPRYNATVENFSIVERFSYLCAFQRGRRAGLKPRYNATVENFSIVEKISYLCAFQRGRRAGLKPRYKTLVPDFISLSTVNKVRLSPSEAARIIPCDSIPLNFAGFRLATRIKFLPINSSGE